ncbi:uncharacterized protein V3H82_019512 isoform 2-T2 [Fundulus diaphanus]
MVCHVIGRKHRQKYVELKRPDLVTWDGNTINTQGGKIMRAKAEIIERQNGRGVPESLLRKGVEGRLNVSRVNPRQKQDGPPFISQKSQQAVPPLLPELQDYRRKRDLSGFNPDLISRNRFEEERRGADFMGGPSYREDRLNPDYSTKYLPEYDEDPLKPAMGDSRDVSRYDYRSPMPRSLDYPPEASSLKRPYPERDPLEEFYSEEVRRGQVRSQGYMPSLKMPLAEDNTQRWSLERESGRHDAMRRHGSSEPESKRRNLPASFEGDRSRESSFDIFKDYHHESNDPYQEQTLERGRPPSAQRHGDVPSAISNIPEPFRRFLKGSGDEEGQSRRKSRFSDATPEEVKMVKDTYRDDGRPSYTKTGADLRPSDAPVRPGVLYGESQPPHLGDGYNRGGSESTSIFDLLKSVEIETEEEANFLKSKLSSLLKEFKAKKMEKAAFSQPYQYERPPREESNPRRSEELEFSSNHRRGWEQREQIPEQQFHEYNHGEARHSSRGLFKDDQPHYDEPMRSHDYKPPSENYFDPRSSVPSLHMEQDSRMHREPRYSSNMDKITCALMDLVARK